ncbi:MAG: phosphoesterase PA-phosphatase-like protein [Nevskia sp.]|nr:phosphoesterase PA-phosphatase-like protein [Nevskia sp.]
MTTGSSNIAWQHQLIPRLAAQWRLKQFVITGGMTTFFVAYFMLLNFTVFPVTEMPVTAIDRLIDFSPQALWLYISLWVYVNLVPALLDSRRELLVYYLSAGAVCIVGLSIFFFWPTTTPAANIDWARYPLFQPLKAVDRSGNAFPSLHACFAIFSGIWLDRLLRQMQASVLVRLLNASWCLGILYSTLATKQHVAVDLFAGVALGTAGAGLRLKISQIAQRFPKLTAAAPGKL